MQSVLRLTPAEILGLTENGNRRRQPVTELFALERLLRVWGSHLEATGTRCVFAEVKV